MNENKIDRTIQKILDTLKDGDLTLFETYGILESIKVMAHEAMAYEAMCKARHESEKTKSN